MILTVEVRADGRWVPVGKIEPGQPPGSMSDNREDGGRDIYLFGLLGPADRACVWRSVGGVDAEVGSARVVTTGGSEVVAHLDEPGETFEIELRTDRSTDRRRVRFALRSGD